MWAIIVDHPCVLCLCPEIVQFWGAVHMVEYGKKKNDSGL